MRRTAVTAVIVIALAAACGPAPAVVARGRQGSWRRVQGAPFTAGASYAVTGLIAPGDGFPAWLAAGTVRASGTAPARAVVWSSLDGVRWGHTDLDQGGARQSEAAAGARRQGLGVVVGTVTTPAGDRDAAVWTSRDGSNWAAVPVDPAPGDQRMTAVAGGPLGFVAAGTDFGSGRAVPAVWTSADGSAWVRAGAGVFSEGTTIEAVAVGRLGAVAVGTIDTGGDIDGMAWFSADGVSWRTVPLGGAGFTGKAAQRVHGVTATAGGFVAVGDDSSGDRRVAVAWTSADGISWQRQPAGDLTIPPGTGSTAGVSAGSVAGGGPVFAAGGSSAVQLWSSPDGRRWAPEPVPASGRDSAEEADVATDGRSVLVSAGGTGLWFRSAGGAWTDAGTDTKVFPRPAPVYELDDMEEIGGRLVAVGSDGDDAVTWQSVDGITWARYPATGPAFVGSVSGLAVAGGTAVAAGTAVGSSHNVAAVWLSTDEGGTWQRIEEGSPEFAGTPTAQMFDVTAGGPGFIAVGLGWDLDTIDAQAWWSADGRNWHRASPAPDWRGPGDQLLNHVCALPDGGVVAVGYVAARGEQDAAAWVSHDGATWERAVGPDAAVLGGPGTQFVTGCASTPAGVLVSGGTAGAGGYDGVLWASADGRSWRIARTFTDPTDNWLRSVAVNANALVVSGIEGGDMSVYTSPDSGTTWRKYGAADFRGGFKVASHLLVVNGAVVAAGVDGAGAAVWVGPAP